LAGASSAPTTTRWIEGAYIREGRGERREGRAG